MSSPACCSPEKVWKIRVCERSAAMKAPVGLLSDRTILHQQDGGASPRQALLTMHRMQTMQGKTRLSRRCAKVCRVPENGKSHKESYDSSWDFGALEGTRIPGPLIKSQMLYRLSYERIFCGKTIPPNNITTIGCKKQERHLKKRKIRLYTKNHSKNLCARRCSSSTSRPV